VGTSWIRQRVLHDTIYERLHHWAGPLTDAGVHHVRHVATTVHIAACREPRLAKSDAIFYQRKLQLTAANNLRTGCDDRDIVVTSHGCNPRVRGIREHASKQQNFKHLRSDFGVRLCATGTDKRDSLGLRRHSVEEIGGEHQAARTRVQQQRTARGWRWIRGRRVCDANYYFRNRADKAHRQAVAGYDQLGAVLDGSSILGERQPRSASS
jgi:hypothetical protein